MAGEIAGFLPDSFDGWVAERTVKMSVPADIYNYIDGGAELYLSYGFHNAISRTYIKEGKEVLAEVYDLAEARNAFGVFTQTREEESGEFGQGTYRVPGAVFFWKDRFYVTLSAWEPDTATDSFISRLAAYVDGSIDKTGNIPDIVSFIPDGMIKDGYRYFHHYVWLNSFFFISDQNILNIDEKCDAVIAKFDDEGKRKHLMMIQYKDYESALSAWSSFSSEFFPEGLTNECVKLEDSTWISACHKDRIIIAVFNASSCKSAVVLMNESKTKFNNR